MPKQKKTIVIIGDWFIDENWLVAKHNTYSSSHTGDVHYISKHKEADKRMISLCGAAEILEVLRHYLGNYQIKGFGAWNKNDDALIKCTLCPQHTDKKYLTPFTIRSLAIPKAHKKCPYVKSSSLSDPTCKFDPELINLSKKGKTVSTNRIIRCYEGYGGGLPHLLYRFDWQLPIAENSLTYDKFNKLNDLIIDSVIIEDHGHGVITETSIDHFIKNLKAKNNNLNRIKWYIRTKIENPQWIRKLVDNKIVARLYVIDYNLAVYTQGQRKWQYGKKLGRSALELLGKLTNDTTYKHGKKEPVEKGLDCHRAAILKDDDNTVIAKEDDKCFNLYKSPGKKQLINIGRTTMFFNALIAQDINNVVPGNNNDFGKQCRKAQRFLRF